MARERARSATLTLRPADLMRILGGLEAVDWNVEDDADLDAQTISLTRRVFKALDRTGHQAPLHNWMRVACGLPSYEA